MMISYTPIMGMITCEGMTGAYASMEEYAALTAENKRLKSSAVCVYCGAIQHTKDGQTKMDMIIDHMAVCEKHPVANLLAQVERLTAEKKELWEGLEEMIRAYVSLLETGHDRIIDSGGECDSVEDMEMSDPFLNKAKTLIAKHREG